MTAFIDLKPASALGCGKVAAEIALGARYDAQDRLSQYNQNEYRYTANGELTEKTDTSTNERTQFDYDAFSNLREVTLPDGTNIEYVIDGQNRRVGKLRNGTLEQGFLYQGQLNPVVELDGNNNLVARFVYGDIKSTSRVTCSRTAPTTE